LTHFKALFYVEKSTLSDKDTSIFNRNRKSGKIFEKPKIFEIFENRPLHPQLRGYVDFLHLKKFLIFSIIL